MGSRAGAWSGAGRLREGEVGQLPTENGDKAVDHPTEIHVFDERRKVGVSLCRA